MQRKAVIDLGTNTFHLFIVEINNHELHTLYKDKVAVKIGENGISTKSISADALDRAINALEDFKKVLDQYEISDVTGVATSAIRNAENGRELLYEIKTKTGIDIQIISGNREAELIYYGVRAAFNLSDDLSLIMDIGGGSVEFIIGNKNKIYWKQSFEIGAQRLLDKFHQVDPIDLKSVKAMEVWLGRGLNNLIQAIKIHQPTQFIGCSGTFDTIKEIYCEESNIDQNVESNSFFLPLGAFNEIHEELLLKNRKQRLAIPGMVQMRVDMIVVASCLINFVLKKINVNNIIACSYALKEGVLFQEHPTDAFKN